MEQSPNMGKPSEGTEKNRLHADNRTLYFHLDDGLGGFDIFIHNKSTVLDSILQNIDTN